MSSGPLTVTSMSLSRSASDVVRVFKLTCVFFAVKGSGLWSLSAQQIRPRQRRPIIPRQRQLPLRPCQPLIIDQRLIISLQKGRS